MTDLVEQVGNLTILRLPFIQKLPIKVLMVGDVGNNSAYKMH